MHSYNTTNIFQILLLNDGPVGGDVGCQGLQLVVVCRDLGQLGQPRTLEAAEAGEAVAWTEGGQRTVPGSLVLAAYQTHPPPSAWRTAPPRQCPNLPATDRCVTLTR